MPEEVAEQLETKRFISNPESRRLMDEAKSIFSEQKKLHPYLSGISFFGSRTKGMEGESSDLDLIVFINEDNNVGPHISEKSIKDIFTNGINSKVDIKVFDISERETQRSVESFIRFIYPYKDLSSAASLTNIYFFSLCARFFLAVGNDVYKNRQFILDQFKASPNGEACFQILMQGLEAFERDRDRPERMQAPDYSGYPKSIRQAEQYFHTEALGGKRKSVLQKFVNIFKKTS